MARYVVLLRGVNVGKGNRVPMAEFRALLEELGCTGVVTLLNSGNAVFTSKSRSATALAKSIAAAISRAFDVTTPVIVKSAAQFAAIVHGNPIVPPDADHSKFLVTFAMDTKQLAALATLEKQRHPDERLAITAHAAYLHCAGGILESDMAKALLDRTGRSVTTRNWGTTLKIHALLGEG